MNKSPIEVAGLVFGVLILSFLGAWLCFGGNSMEHAMATATDTIFGSDSSSQSQSHSQTPSWMIPNPKPHPVKHPPIKFLSLFTPDGSVSINKNGTAQQNIYYACPISKYYIYYNGQLYKAIDLPGHTPIHASITLYPNNKFYVSQQMKDSAKNVLYYQ